MAATFSYYYTVDAYVKWSTIIDSDTVIAQVEQDTFLNPNLNMPDWIQIYAESMSTKSSIYTVQKGFQIKWRVRFYCKKVDGSTTTWYWLSDDAVRNVHASFSAYKGKVSNTDPAVSTVGGVTAFTVPNTTVVQNPTSGKVFTFWLNTTQSNFKLSPAFTLTADIQINTTDMFSKYGGDSNSDVQHATLLGINPVFAVYDAKPVPSVTPPSLLAALHAQGSTYVAGSTYSYAFDRCNNDWYGLYVSPVVADTKGNFKYSFYTVTCKPNGTGLVQSSTVSEQIKGPTTASTVGPQLTATRKKIQQIIIANCSSQAGAGGNGGGTPPPADPTGGSNDLNSDSGRWNPPTHRFSRDVPFTLRTLTNDTAASINQGINSELNNIATQALLESNPLIKDFTKLQTGRIFQDTEGAKALNTNPDKLKSIDALKGPKQWGFRFMYNPTTFGYNTASNNSVDWTFGSKDPATLLSGNQSVTFQLYLNRIPDMAYLTSLAKGYASANVSEEYAYGRNLTNDEKEGLLKRGTEYDIEFIYRVLNGDPTAKPLLFSTDYKGVTADFGYTTGTPCWLVLNDNLRYYGSVASLDVSHVMFDLNMVPILSTVTVNFSRYPALWTDPAAGGYSRSDLQNALKPPTISTITTPGS